MRDYHCELNNVMVANMSETRFHGVRVRENTDLVTAINDIESSVIGVVAVADDADADTFPLNTPVLLTRVNNVLGKAGKTGSLYKTLKAIADQTSPKVIVVRVAAATEEEGGKTQSQLIMGGTAEDGSYTGMYAFLTAEQRSAHSGRTRLRHGRRDLRAVCHCAEPARVCLCQLLRLHDDGRSYRLPRNLRLS